MALHHSQELDCSAFGRVLTSYTGSLGLNPQQCINWVQNPSRQEDQKFRVILKLQREFEAPLN